jgi:hypothetical protein
LSLASFAIVCILIKIITKLQPNVVRLPLAFLRVGAQGAQGAKVYE